ncbi:hypothetical protein L226DRAFT_533274 [Lentinus tigrinus ALCF2SS1-7]|nr:hypothetical protein L226DRAFT_533274 [Lentinus tigrinus ALCF2SS1-7]
MAQKMSIRFQFVGHTPYSRQASVLRSTKGNGRVEQPTKGFLATLAARELERFMESENARDPSCFPYRLDQLVLLDIRLVSDGSLQPSVGVFLPRT